MAGFTSVPQTEPPGVNWRNWCDVTAGASPYQYALVEAWRREWQCVEVLRLADMHPGMNVAGLYWRPLQPPRLEPEVPEPAGAG
jgi:hypothetical protein